MGDNLSLKYKKMKPLVAIGVPVYNGEEFLEECLESILKQSYLNWECVVVNNQSTDGTASIVESFEKRDNRFRLVTNPEFVDMTTNFNNAHKYSNESKYFKVVCADDWILPDYLEKMVEIMESYPNVGLCSSYRMDSLRVRCTGLNYYDGPVFDGKKLLHDQLTNTVPDVLGSETTLLFRTEALKKVKNYPTIFDHKVYNSDTSLAYELLFLSDMGFAFQVLSYTRRGKDTFTSQYTNRFNTILNLREGELYKYKSLLPGLENEYKDVRDRYGRFLFKRRLSGDRECIKWHDQHLDPQRKFTLKEQLSINLRLGLKKLFNLRKQK